jgi:TonB family protein
MEMMKKVGWLRTAALATLGIAICCAVPSMRADGNRKIVNGPKPQYSGLAKKLKLSGTVKIEVMITPGGQVKETKALGGHPLLVESAVEAVREWKFEPGSSATTEILEFKFDLQQ